MAPAIRTLASGGDPYAHIARFYEAEHVGLEADVAFFARHGAAGSLLVLGCGTGRVGRVLGTERRVVGLDRSPPMLAIARQKAPAAEYVEGDMRAFDLGPFREIIVPNGAFSFLPTRDDQLRCLRCCHQTLPPGAPLTLDVPMPCFDHLCTPHTPERSAWTGEIDGREARRTREVHRRPVAQQLHLTDRYYVEGAVVATAELVLRLIFPAEAEWMLEAAGFGVEALYGDYAARPLHERSPRLILRAVRL